MKKTLFLILGVLLFCASSYSQTTEEKAIKKVCIAQTKAFNDFDIDALAAYHVQSVNDQLTINKSDGSYSVTSGWENINKALKNYFQKSKKGSVKLASDNFMFVVQGKMAFVCYNASSQNTNGKTTISREYRTLQKIKGQWKILAVLVYIDYIKAK
jgi:ketosteroid isomerase-like protein